eukprot:CAMPEP_0179344130 /NCGR_PEP_ID=MMETSP0797-20121207/71344_1 /TAXON_ID=47934 /ORGANISM="Dinophysis acuminata, Strain DAEP01" /LENGTH=35 /DNA_ID= /DNA_START= /DNA_END= /DNA_ORIENTATION=
MQIGYAAGPTQEALSLEAACIINSPDDVAGCTGMQ